MSSAFDILNELVEVSFLTGFSIFECFLGFDGYFTSSWSSGLITGGIVVMCLRYLLMVNTLGCCRTSIFFEPGMN